MPLRNRSQCSQAQESTWERNLAFESQERGQLQALVEQTLQRVECLGFVSGSIDYDSEEAREIQACVRFDKPPAPTEDPRKQLNSSSAKKGEPSDLRSLLS